MPANTVAIDEVTELIIHRKTDASSNTARYGMKSGATEVDNGADLATPSGYNLMTLVGPAPGASGRPTHERRVVGRELRCGGDHLPACGLGRSL